MSGSSTFRVSAAVGLALCSCSTSELCDWELQEKLGDRVEVSSVIRLESKRGVCSGIVIGQGVALTAEHCVGGDLVAHIEGMVLPVERAVTHPTRDLAILHFMDDEATTWVAAPLPQVAVQTTKGAEVFVAGWGAESCDPTKAKVLSMRVERETELGFLVSAPSGHGPCDGDSGGPLFLEQDASMMVVIAVLSTGSALCEGEDVYHRFDNDLSWVSAELQR